MNKVNLCIPGHRAQEHTEREDTGPADAEQVQGYEHFDHY